MKKCEAIKKNGDPCGAWAMPNGYCRRHGGKAVVDQEPSDSLIKELKAEETDVSENPAEIETEKPIIEKCGAFTSRGAPCKLRAVENGRCRRHQGAPDAQPEAFLKEKKATVPKTSPQKIYSSYISNLIDKGEEEVFEEFYNLLHKDFVLNNSSDRMNCEIACIYYTKLLRAIKSDDIEAFSQLDRLLRAKLHDLKSSKGK